MNRTLTLAFALAVSTAGLSAQMAPAPTTMVSPAQSIDAMVTALEKQFVPLIEAMPEAKFDFAPSNAMFTGTMPAYDGVRTFRQEALHVAQAFYNYGSQVSGTKRDPEMMKRIGELKTKAEVVEAVKASFTYFHAQVATLTAANAFEHAGRGADDTRVSMATGGVGHGWDHYGQLVEYLRMNGVTPPASAGRPAANPAAKKPMM